MPLGGSFGGDDSESDDLQFSDADEAAMSEAFGGGGGGGGGSGSGSDSFSESYDEGSNTDYTSVDVTAPPPPPPIETENADTSNIFVTGDDESDPTPPEVDTTIAVTTPAPEPIATEDANTDDIYIPEEDPPPPPLLPEVDMEPPAPWNDQPPDVSNVGIPPPGWKDVGFAATSKNPIAVLGNTAITPDTSAPDNTSPPPPAPPVASLAHPPPPPVIAGNKVAPAASTAVAAATGLQNQSAALQVKSFAWWLWLLVLLILLWLSRKDTIASVT
jgi:hypothetical protein